MVKLNELNAGVNAKKTKKRVGRGPGSGTGKTSTRGHKGQWARSGGGVRRGFEGGQMPLSRRLPKVGFNNIFAKVYTTINVSDLEAFSDGEIITVEMLKSACVIKKINDGLKILGDGELTKKLTVRAKKFTKSAQQKIEAAGGSAEVI